MPTPQTFVSREFEPEKYNRWLFDCGATNTVTYYKSDLFGHLVLSRKRIQSVNGYLSQVHGAGNIALSPTLRLHNCLYVPSLSCKLLSINHVTKELNCMVLMYPTFCVL